jgi:predicted nucleotidyltransferase component of viral defense system
MIPHADITEWRKYIPWQSDAQVEQDLIISRGLVEIFDDPMLNKKLAFRGGTAIHKLHLQPPVRYSEDIDLVQIEPGPIGEIFDRVRERLEFLDKPRIRQKSRNNTMIFSFQSEIPPIIPLKLKVEINCREHISCLELVKIPFNINSRWFSGECHITTYRIEELLGSKLRALYQRKKGRDLFDLWYALIQKRVSIPKIIDAFYIFLDDAGCSISRKDFLKNMTEKLKDQDFRDDITGLIRTDVVFDIDGAWQLISENLVSKMK